MEVRFEASASLEELLTHLVKESDGEVTDTSEACGLLLEMLLEKEGRRFQFQQDVADHPDHPLCVCCGKRMHKQHLGQAAREQAYHILLSTDTDDVSSFVVALYSLMHADIPEDAGAQPADPAEVEEAVRSYNDVVAPEDQT